MSNLSIWRKLTNLFTGKVDKSKNRMDKKMTKCLMLTGAGARISQEVALIDLLIEKQGLKISEDDTLIAGFSSGGLNLMAVNGCFRNDNPKDWEDYYKKGTLWPLKTSDVYTPNLHKLPLYDTTPLRKTLDKFLSDIGVDTMGDLPFNSFVLTYSERQFATKWANNFLNTNNQTLKASDLFMSSASIPFVFGHQEIANEGEPRNFPKGKFNDGGSIGQFERFGEHIGDYVLENGPFEILHIISPMREAPAEPELSKLGKDHGLKKFETNMLFKAFYRFLVDMQQWQEKNGPVARKIEVCIPRMDHNFPMLKFGDQQAQYNRVMEWYEENPDEFAVPLDQFIETHKP